MLADSHCHLDQFTDEEVAALVKRAEDAGVGLIVTVGSDLASSRRAIHLAESFAIIHAGAGMHPMELKASFSEQDRAALKALAAGPNVVCISETGLDFLETSPDRGWQDVSFREHIRIARDVGKPLDFHAREASEAILPVMREERAEEAGAIWHYFEYEARLAREALGMGFYISLAKPLLRKPELQEVVKGIPMDRIVLETDSYPQPWKKKPAMRTEPSHVVQVARKVGELKGMTLDEVAAITTANLKRALRLS